LVTLITRLFQNLAAARLHDLDDIFPLFEHPIGDPTERWNQQKRRPTKPFAQVATDKTRVLHSHLQVDHASKAQLRLLRLQIRLFLEQLLAPFVLGHTMLDGSPVETATHWGSIPKYTLPVTRAYSDGSATKNESCAGFGVHFPELPVPDHRRNIQSRIPGHQTNARAEALGILAALLASRRDTDLEIHCDRLSLVDQLNKYKLRPPFDFELKDIPDQSIILCILHEVRTRIGTTRFTHVKAHKRDTMSDIPFEMLSINKQHQELNKIADKLAKGSLSQPSATIPLG
jgi:ribonuclease HI